MQLLVSVRNASEARAALEGGAHIIDAKEPAAGALGPVAPETLAGIRDAVPDQVPLSAALGEGSTLAAIEAGLARVGVALAFVKFGFLGIGTAGEVRRLLAHAVRLAERHSSPPRVMAVAYADWERTGSLDPARFPPIIHQSGAHGLLVDTALKGEGRLFDLVGVEALTGIGEALRRLRLRYAIAGSLDGRHLPGVLKVGPDILGVRGAVTEGGRNGKVGSDRVRALADALHQHTGDVTLADRFS